MLGYVVAHLVEALHYKPEGRGFDFQWCQWNFYTHNTSGRTMALWSNQPLTELSKGSQCVGQTTLPPSVVHCLQI
jgi:hypothetical protein